MAQHLKRFVFLLSNRRLKTTKSLKRLKNGGIFSQFFLHQLLTWFRYFLHTIQKKKIFESQSAFYSITININKHQ